MAADRTTFEDDLGNARLAGHVVPDLSASMGDTLTAQGPGEAAIWLPQSGGAAVNSVTAADASIVIAGTSADPTVATGTLDVIATVHPPAADWSNNSHKIDLAKVFAS